MTAKYSLGKIGKLKITAAPSAIGGFILLWPVFSLLGLKVFRLRPRQALTGGLLATVFHFLSEIWHQMGHARAAEQTGYPMDGVHLWSVLGTSIYPTNEPELPPEIHVERALGGPRSSAMLALAGGMFALVMRAFSPLGFMLGLLLALENLLVFTLGAFFPLPFMETDGTTIKRYRDTHRKRMVIIQE
ncbi:MAG: hypothetical protein KJ046_00630 [Anaerolineae bacterium]|nr:hypothetical protein [Anaerolineae bacterium]